MRARGRQHHFWLHPVIVIDNKIFPDYFWRSGSLPCATSPQNLDRWSSAMLGWGRKATIEGRWACGTRQPPRTTRDKRIKFAILPCVRRNLSGTQASLTPPFLAIPSKRQGPCLWTDGSGIDGIIYAILFACRYATKAVVCIACLDRPVLLESV